MAEFSKQWLEVNGDGETGGWDFDIEAVASTISNSHYSHYICEGFGFVAIGKNEIGETILAYRNWESNTDEIQWKNLIDVINEETERHGK